MLCANRSRRGTLGGRRFSAKLFMFGTAPIPAILGWWIRFDATQRKYQSLARRPDTPLSNL